MRQPTFHFLFFVLFATIFSHFSIRAEVNSNDLSCRIDSIESFTDRLKSMSEWVPKVTGYASFAYSLDSNSSTFDVRNAILDINGKLPAKFDYRLLSDIYKFLVYDARLRYLPFKELKFCVGQFKVPFSIGNLNGPLQEELIDYPLVIRQLVHGGMVGLSTSGRDVGCSIFGDVGSFHNHSIFDYAVGVFNGNGMKLKDNNMSKDVAARISLHPVKGMSVSGSYYWGEFGSDYLRYNRWCAGIAYFSRLGLLKCEYIGATTGATNSYGWYALIGANLPHRMRPLFRFDYLNFDSCINDIQRNYTIGVDYRPFKFLRLQLNYCRISCDSPLDKANENQLKMVVMGIL